MPLSTVNLAEPEKTRRYQVGGGAAAIWGERVAEDHFPDFVAGTIENVGAPLFVHLVDPVRLRMKSLRRKRMIWGVISLLCVCALVASIYFRLPYEPAAAILCCCFGIFIVFVLKVEDAKG